MVKLAIDGGEPVRGKFLVFGAPCLGEDEIREVVDTMRSGWIGTGPKVERFEREFAAYVGAPHAVAVSSCTAGLHLALLVSGVGPGDEVVTSPLTFAATANVIVHCGARPVFVDVDPQTLNLDPARLAAALTPRTRVVLPVHFGGLAADLDTVHRAAPDVTIVEDAAHAVGTRYRGKLVGGHGNLVCFSFYANKNLTTVEGGMIAFADGSLRDRLLVLRLHGMDRDAWKRYQGRAVVATDVVEAGYKYNLTDLQASIGIHQLAKIEAFQARREALAALYDDAFRDLAGVRRQVRPAEAAERHALHLYVLILEPEAFRASRDEVVAALRAENVGAGIHYRAVHLEPFYRRLLPDLAGTLPVAERIGASVLTLPLTPGMSDADAQDVVDAVHKVLGAYRR